LPGFRAAERTFQLVTQVAGRTGRGPRGGHVLVQTLSPEAPSIMAAVRHDYAAFAAEELPYREALGYPPFGALVRLVIRGPQERTTLAVADELVQRIKQATGQLETQARVLGPAPAPVAKLRGNFRFQVQMQSPDREALREIVKRATADWKLPDGVQWIADIDPLDMM
jgi:primosomal protein N' (replication factor Y)